MLMARDIAVLRMTAMPGRDFGRAQGGPPGIQFRWDLSSCALPGVVYGSSASAARSQDLGACERRRF